MIRITDFASLLCELTNSIPGVAGHVLVASEKHLVNRLGDEHGVWLAVTIPSADAAVVNEDNVAENNIVWIFILEKIDPGSVSALDEIGHYQKIQDVATALKNWLRDKKLEGDSRLEHLDLKSVHTDPEYQFGGWNGWSINFNFDTDGY